MDRSLVKTSQHLVMRPLYRLASEMRPNLRLKLAARID
jgi:hypothetical protein